MSDSDQNSLQTSFYHRKETLLEIQQNPFTHVIKNRAQGSHFQKGPQRILARFYSNVIRARFQKCGVMKATLNILINLGSFLEPVLLVLLNFMCMYMYTEYFKV